ncbi:nuclear hormone receptor HR96 [Hetaerina americana]|uniref:nuclear hormone receptor HR96 n=1 Tax=Hetaerina americana TaxID=62018 RepID=UPI003A7F1182
MGEEDISPDTPPSQGSQGRESSRGSKVCGVCGDQALGYNFNAITCESCKAFFRRNALRNKEFQCPFNDACEITAVTRRFCQRCRLRKCFAIGMRKDWILSEEDKRLKREKVESNKASGRKRPRSGSTPSSSNSSRGHEKAVPSPAIPADVAIATTPDSVLSDEKSSVKSPLPPSVSPGPQTSPTTQQTKPQAWVTGTPQVKVPKLESSAEEMIPSLPRSSPVSVITSPNSIITQISTVQSSPVQVSSMSLEEELAPSSFDSHTSVYASPAPLSHPSSVLTEESPIVPYSPSASISSPPSAAGSLSPHSATTLPRSTPLLNSLIVNQNSEDYISTFYSKDATSETVKLQEIGRRVKEDRRNESNEVSKMNPVKVEGLVSSTSPSPTWWVGGSGPDGTLEDSSRSILLTPESPDESTVDKAQKKTVPVPEVTERIDCMAKLANDTVSQLAPITLEDNWDFHTSLSRRIPIAPDSIGSILSEAIKIEFEALGPLHCSIPSSGDGGCGGSGSLQRHLNEVERSKLNELVVANQALLAPLDADLSAPLDTSVCGGGEPVLLDIINLTAVAIRRLIKMSKRIGAFKSLCQEDQVALLKGGCTEMMILRSVMTYDPDKDSWKIPHSGTSRSRGSPNLIKVDVLKKAPGNVYEEHQRFLRTFDARWRSDESVMLLLSAITLFSPQRPHVVHSDVVRLEQNSYYYLLRRYLENVCPNGCEARSTFLHLIQKMAELHRLNEEHVKVYLDVNPRDVEPLLIEIFDLKPH